MCGVNRAGLVDEGIDGWMDGGREGAMEEWEGGKEGILMSEALAFLIFLTFDLKGLAEV